MVEPSEETPPEALVIEVAMHDPERCGMIPSRQPVDHAVCVQCGRWMHRVTLEEWHCLMCDWFGKIVAEGGGPQPPRRRRRRRQR